MDVSRLQSLEVFSELPQEDLKVIGTFAKETSASAGARLAREGEYAYELAVIEEGTAEVVRHGERIAELGPGDVFGEIGLLDNTLRTADVVATSSIRLVCLSSWDMKRLPRLEERVREVLEQRRQRDAAPGS